MNDWKGIWWCSFSITCLCVLYMNYLSCPEPLCLLLCETSSVSLSSNLLSNSTGTTMLKGCWQFYITLNTFFFDIQYIFILIYWWGITFVCLCMIWAGKMFKRFIGCLQFFVMDSLKICAIFKLTSWQSSFKLTGYLYIIYNVHVYIHKCELVPNAM